MTPQEKADEIIKSFRIAISTPIQDTIAKHNPRHAKNCALLAIDEILDALKFMPYDIQYLSARDYFQEVKEELEQL